jgi:hypothetical protein
MSAFDPDDSDLRDDALWRLLGQVRDVEPSPFFARKVLRAIEAEESAPPSWWEGFVRLFAPLGVCAALGIIAMVGAQRGDQPSTVASSEIEFETIQNLDLLVSNYESSLWLDSSSSY